jgi:hypothetical protein
MTSFPFEGSSSRRYEFFRHGDGLSTANISRQRGLFLIATGDATQPKPRYIAVAENLRAEIEKHHAEQTFDVARELYGEFSLYFRPMGKDVHLAYEQMDLIDRYDPQMNRDPADFAKRQASQAEPR